ncbi:hypothetical protein [Hyphomonas sp.]|uniref:hypothetical protein n=1 Tax=Hyphomonas sp. TaxID=87 RepID=UPI00391CFC9E
MAYDLRTSAIPAISNADTINKPNVLPEFGAPDTVEALRDRLQDLWDQTAVLIAQARSTEVRYPERFLWETLEALNIFDMSHGISLPSNPAVGKLHGDYSQPDIPLRPLVWDGEDWVSYLEDIQPGGSMLDVILAPFLVNQQVVNAGNQELVNNLRTELRGGVAEARDTLQKLSDAIDAIAIDTEDLALTGVPTAPTAALGTNTTQIATMAAVKAAADAAAAASIPLAQKGANSGVASLDSGGKVPAGQLPSYVDDVVEAVNFAALPGPGETGKIYVTLNDNKIYRWSGSAYIEIVGSPGSTDAVPEGAVNKYFTDARAQSALSAALSGKQNLLSGTSGQVLAFDGAGAPVARNAPQRLSTWHFTSDGVTDCTAALQTYLNLGGRVHLADGTYVATALTVPANTELTGSRNAILKKANTAGTFITVDGDNVTLRGFTVDGTHTDETRASGYIANHIGISCVGTSSLDRKGIRFEDLLVKNFGDKGIYTRWTDGLRSIRNRVERCGYSGEEHLSPINGECLDCHWENIFPGQTGNDNAYGGVMTASGTDRVPQNSGFTGCTAKDVTSWVGIDIHYGRNCWIEQGEAIECAEGVTYQNSISGAPGANIDVNFNRVRAWAGETKTRDGRAYTKTGGIVIVGAATGERATNVNVRGNTLINCGDTRPGTGGAILVRNVDGLLVTTNALTGSHRAAISLQQSDANGSCINATVMGNTINGVAQHNSVCRGIDMSAGTRGVCALNEVTALATGTQEVYQEPGATQPVRVLHELPDRLQAARTYYVRTGGSDSASGLLDTDAGAFATLQKAIDVAAGLDTNGFDVTIVVRSGTHASAALKSMRGGGWLVILGDTATPSNVVIAGSSLSAIRASAVFGNYRVLGVKLQTTTAGSGIDLSGAGINLEYGNCDFGACADHHISVSRSKIKAINTNAITGQAATHINALQTADVDITSFAYTLSGTLNFGTAFVRALRNSYVGANGASFTGGTITGTRYITQEGSVIFTGGGGASFFPGSVNGTEASGGVYA